MMWMMGYNDGGDSNSNSIQDPFTGRKLRPLMPRPDSTRPSGLARFHATDHFLALNHHLAMVEHSKREFRTQQVVVSSRWNPTPEQLQTLEELYRTGTRTPTADQIQQITAQLRRYGKIEGKNVFYWFQNHKARERQKRRRQLESLAHDHPPPLSNSDTNNNNLSLAKKGSEKTETRRGLSRTGYEVEETKRWAASPTNSSTMPEKSRQGGSKGAEEEAAEMALCQQGRNATWRTMQPSACPDSLSSYPDPRSTAQTLQLFPLESDKEEDGGQLGGRVEAPFQFFEFLPLKN